MVSYSCFVGSVISNMFIVNFHIEFKKDPVYTGAVLIRYQVLKIEGRKVSRICRGSVNWRLGRYTFLRIEGNINTVCTWSDSEIAMK